MGGSVPATLSPEKLLKEMAGLWVNLGKEGGRETGAGVLRACSMTLVVVAEHSEDFTALGETIAALMPEHPARVIVVRLQGGSEGGLAARVFAQCWMPFGQRRQICCEQIEITGPETSLEDAASVIDPLIAPDLPVIVWCRNPRILDTPGFARLAGLARKVIVDSGSWPDAPAALRKLAEMQGGVVVGDLSWTHLTCWREAVSLVFESGPYAARLSGITRVRIQYDQATMAAMARYLSAWLLTGLGRAGAHAELSLEPGAAEPRIELDGGGFHAQFERSGQRLVTTVDGLSRCTSLPVPTDYNLLREELGIVQRDLVFERALAAAVRL